MNFPYTIFERVSDFFFKPDDRYAGFLPSFRTAVALACLIHFCTVWRYFLDLYGSNGVVPADLVGLLKPSWIPSFKQLAGGAEAMLTVSEALTAIIFKVLYVVVCLVLIRGWMVPISAGLLLFLHLVLTKGAPLYAYGIDSFRTIALFYCITFSVGNRFIVGATPFRRILQLHLCIVYFFSGFEKLLGYNWHNGEAVWKALHLPYMKTAISQHVEKLGDYPLVFIVAGWAVIFIEMAYPVFMNLSKTRTFWLVAAVLLHLGITVSLGLYFFSAMMIILNLSALANLRRLSGDLLTIRRRPLEPAHQSP